MPLFKVWDPQNESLSSASEYEANDAREAAEKYASEDIDGDYSGGCDLMTRDDDGIATHVTVAVEYEPSYHAHANALPDGYSIHVSTIWDAEAGDEVEIYQWEHVSGEVSGHVHGDKFVRDFFGSWEEAAADIREQQDLTD